MSTPNLRQGDFVQGYFLDGEDAQQPVIMGVLGFNQYTAVMKNVPDTAFTRFSGFDTKDIVPQHSLRLQKEEAAARSRLVNVCTDMLSSLATPLLLFDAARFLTCFISSASLIFAMCISFV